MPVDPVNPIREVGLENSNVPISIPIPPIVENQIPNPNDVMSTPPDILPPLEGVKELDEEGMEALQAEVENNISHMETTLSEMTSPILRTAPVRLVLRDWLSKRIIRGNIVNSMLETAEDPVKNYTIEALVFTITESAETGQLFGKSSGAAESIRASHIVQKLSDIFKFASLGGLCYLELSELPKLIGEAGTLIYRRSILSEAQDIFKEMKKRVEMDPSIARVLAPYIEDLEPWIKGEEEEQRKNCREFLGNTLVASPDLIRGMIRVGSEITPVLAPVSSLVTYITVTIDSSYRLYNVTHQTNAVAHYKANLKKRLYNTPDPEAQLKEVTQAKQALKSLVLEKTRQESKFLKFFRAKTSVEFSLLISTAAFGIVIVGLVLGGITLTAGLIAAPPITLILLFVVTAAVGLYYLHVTRPHLFKTLFTKTPLKLAFYRLKLAFYQYQRLNKEIKQALNLLKLDNVIVEHTYNKEELEQSSRTIEAELVTLKAKIDALEEGLIHPLEKEIAAAGTKDFFYNAFKKSGNKIDDTVIDELVQHLLPENEIDNDLQEFLKEYTGIDTNALSTNKRLSLQDQVTFALKGFFGSTTQTYFDTMVSPKEA